MSRDSLVGRLFAGSALVFVGLVVQFLFGFLSRAVLARLLGQAGYGAITLGLTLVTSLSLVAVVGLDTGVARYLPRFGPGPGRRTVVTAGMTIALPVATLFGAAVVVGAPVLARRAFADPSLTGVLRWFGVAIPLAALVRLTVGVARGQQRAAPRVYLRNVGLPAARFLLPVGAVLLGVELVGVAVSFAVAYLLVGVACVWFLLRQFDEWSRASGAGSGPVSRRELLAFSLPLMVSAATTTVFANVDTFLIGALATVADVGVYRAVYPLAALLTTVLTAFNYLFMPAASELDAEDANEAIGDAYGLVTKWVLLSSLPLLLVLVSFPAASIGLTFGPTYTEGALALVVLAVGFFTHVVAGPAGNVLTALGHSRLVMYDSVVVAVANVALNLALIPRYGYLGAAVATTAGYAVMNALYLLQLYRLTGTRPVGLRPLGVAAGATLLWGPLVVTIRLLHVDALVALAACALAFGPAYLALLALTALTPAEAGLIGSAEETLDVDLSVLRSLAHRGSIDDRSRDPE